MVRPDISLRFKQGPSLCHCLNTNLSQKHQKFGARCVLHAPYPCPTIPTEGDSLGIIGAFEMARNELQDKIVNAIVLMLLTLSPQETEYYRAILKHYENELNSGSVRRSPHAQSRISQSRTK